MNPDSITERQFTRSRHFGDATKDEALKQTTFYQEQIGFYLANVFKDQGAYRLECTRRFDTDRVYTIRKGSAILIVTTVFGLNTSYKETPPRKFYTFTTTASHRNEVLDNTGKVNEVIEWSLRITGGLVIGVVFSVILLLFGGHLGIYLISLAFAFGSAVGSFIGQHIARKIYSTVETRLDEKGELTDIDHEWTLLTDTLAIVFGEVPAVPNDAS